MCGQSIFPPEYRKLGFISFYWAARGPTIPLHRNNIPQQHSMRRFFGLLFDVYKSTWRHSFRPYKRRRRVFFFERISRKNINGESARERKRGREKERENIYSGTFSVDLSMNLHVCVFTYNHSCILRDYCYFFIIIIVMMIIGHFLCSTRVSELYFIILFSFFSF